ncbi:MAG: peptidoglycan-binding protein, partial [Clostridia bacterium]|nr:peptidoglycan-binding protein [Clostridia bacterium]
MVSVSEAAKAALEAKRAGAQGERRDFPGRVPGDTQSKTSNMTKAETAKKSIEEIAKEVIRGNWGNGADRKAKLEAAGYN